MKERLRGWQEKQVYEKQVKEADERAKASKFLANQHWIELEAQREKCRDLHREVIRVMDEERERDEERALAARKKGKENINIVLGSNERPIPVEAGVLAKETQVQDGVATSSKRM